MLLFYQATLQILHLITNQSALLIATNHEKKSNVSEGVLRIMLSMFSQALNDLKTMPNCNLLNRLNETWFPGFNLLSPTSAELFCQYFQSYRSLITKILNIWYCFIAGSVHHFTWVFVIIAGSLDDNCVGFPEVRYELAASCGINTPPLLR